MEILKNYINGKFVSSTKKELMDVINPSTEAVIAQIPKGAVEDAKKAIDAAAAAQPAWEKVPAYQRGDFLYKIAEKLEAKLPEFAKKLTEESGKTIKVSTDELESTVSYIKYMATWARKYEGEILQSDRENENILIFKRPIGVVAGILAWNFPMSLFARKFAPALVTGNTVVIKPSELTPITATLFAKLIDEVKLPKGVFNLIHGDGATLGAELSSNSKVGLVSLTGSVGAGQKTMESASKNLTKLSLELGGKAPAIVCDDADLDIAAKAIYISRITNNGQVCNCAERIYVDKKVKKAFLDKFLPLVKNTKVGNPNLDKKVDMGPLASEKAVENMVKVTEKAVAQGGKVLCGGKRIKGKGYYYEATVIDNVKNDFDIIQKETFGPIIPIVTFEKLDEAIAMSNDSEYGLASSVYTTNINKAFKVIRGLKFGETYLNRENGEAIQGFHAGYKKSGTGGADGRHGLEEFLQTQVVYIDTDPNV